MKNPEAGERRRLRSAQLLELYSDTTLWVRLNAILRPWFLPVEFISTFFTTGQSVVDLGCSYGLLLNLLWLDKPGLQLLGVDKSKSRIAQAQRTIGDRENIAFKTGDANRIQRKADGFIMVDFLHHLHIKDQNVLLLQLYQLVSPGGHVIILEVPDRPRLKAALSRFSDWVLYPFDVKAQFRAPQELRGVLERCGFEVSIFERPTGIFAGIGYACRRPLGRGSE